MMREAPPDTTSAALIGVDWGTTYLRAQLLAEPARARSLALLRSYTELSLRMSHEVPGSSVTISLPAICHKIQ